MLFPNRFNKKNLIRKNESITVPAASSIFQIRIDAPFGNELLKAVVSLKPLAFFDDLDLTGINAMPIGEEEGKMLAKSVMALAKSNWAEHQVGIRTVESRTVVPPERNVKRPLLKRIMFRLQSPWRQPGRNG